MIKYNPAAQTLRESLGPAMMVSDEAEAFEFYRDYVDVLISNGIPKDKATQLAWENINYFSGYYGDETRRKVSSLFPYDIVSKLSSSEQETEFIQI